MRAINPRPPHRAVLACAIGFAGWCCAPRVPPASIAADDALSRGTPLRQLHSPPPLASVLLQEVDSPFVSIRIVFHAGSGEDPPGKEGLNALVAALLLTTGSSTLSAQQVMHALYRMGATLSTLTTKELTIVTGRVHRDNADQFIALLSDVLLHPRFDPETFEQRRSQSLSVVLNDVGSNDELLCSIALDTVLFAGRPYGHTEVGTVHGLRSITLDDIRTNYRRNFTQDRAVFGLAGAATPEMAARLKSRLEQLPPHGPPAPPVAAAPPVARTALVLQKNNLATTVFFGHTYALRRVDPDFIPVVFALSYLGEHRQSTGVLFKELRTRRGLNYGDYAYAERYIEDTPTTYPMPGMVQAQQGTMFWLRPIPPENTVFAVRAALYFLDRLLRHPIPADEFRRARDFLIQYSRLWEQTDDRKLGYALDALFEGTSSFLESFRAGLATLTPESVLAAVRRHIHPERFNFVFVARDAEKLAAQLRSGAPSPISYASAKPKELLDEDAEIARFPLPIRPQQIRIAPANAPTE